ncbi:hypothetical protein EDC44_13119 [Cricetibacter osteomyelitidis]|uniref:Uncharacterized protein n=1 Tax=Cricetibacter osteomyelitidis TaxID=1521931 RepID=A0A4V2T0W2_9PAST|nr:hypothetical protein [Cricetibacter osteomyelitidis]TCP91313.1 hypothetical protein EDC44_13119 [Cricetibacter osteomyelitidis]
MNSKVKLHSLVYISLAINVVLLLISAPEFNEISEMFMPIMFIIWGIGAAGAVLFNVTGKKSGCVLIIISCAIFTPIGLLGVFGAVKTIEQINRRKAGIAE